MRYALDTNVWLYLSVSRRFADDLRAADLTPVGLSSVVAFELRRRAISKRAVAVADDIIGRWGHAVLAPLHTDWLSAVAVLREVRRRQSHDPRGLARLQNDALIAASCARAGWTVVTANRDDYQLIAEAFGPRAPRLHFMDAPASSAS